MRLAPARRGIAVAGVLAALATGPPATAESRACDLLRDRRGDDAVQQEPAVVHLSDSLDIVSADVATTPKLLIAVVRLARLGLDDPAAPAGQLYSFDLRRGSVRFRLEARRTRTGNLFSASVYGDSSGTGGVGRATLTSLGDVEGFFDDVRSEVHVRVPLVKLKSHASFAPGDELRGLRANSYRNVGESGGATGLRPPSTASWSDEATGSARYTVGAASCVLGR